MNMKTIFYRKLYISIQYTSFHWISLDFIYQFDPMLIVHISIWKFLIQVQIIRKAEYDNNTTYIGIIRCYCADDALLQFISIIFLHVSIVLFVFIILYYWMHNKFKPYFILQVTRCSRIRFTKNKNKLELCLPFHFQIPSH